MHVFAACTYRKHVGCVSALPVGHQASFDIRICLDKLLDVLRKAMSTELLCKSLLKSVVVTMRFVKGLAE